MNARTRFVVGGMAFLFLVSWVVAMGRLIATKFWDDRYSLEFVRNAPVEPLFYNSTALHDVGASYFTGRRYVYFFPHVATALVWWNLYFLQLVPWIRRNYRAFHRYLGRALMIAAAIQVVTGLGLATTSHSSVIKIASFGLALAVTYCIYQAWYYAYYGDIPKHKYWVTRLVGYLQTIALQRFWMMTLILTHQAGFYGLYPPFDGMSQTLRNKYVLQLFDDSFVVSILSAVFVTEWYLAGEMKMMEPPPRAPTGGKTAPIAPDAPSQT